jgi:hypothetical protein
MIKVEIIKTHKWYYCIYCNGATTSLVVSTGSVGSITDGRKVAAPFSIEYILRRHRQGSAATLTTEKFVATIKQ